MKKVLFVLGLALCSTFAMAQTNNRAGKLCAPTGSEKVAFTVAEQQVDYKASIFTKDGEDVVLGHFNFSDTSTFTIGVVQATDVIDDTVVGAINCHGRTETSSRWARINDTTAIDDSAFAEDYAELIWRLGKANLRYAMGSRNDITDNNGFMLLSPGEQNYDYTALNTYFSLPPVPVAGAQLVDVTWRQLYCKYYDVCFLDYKTATGWHAIEVNVTGVDVGINEFGAFYCVYTMPADAIASDSLELRFRFTADGSLFYGYGWAIDDVKIVVPSATARWTFNSPININGFYGTIPQGMTVPMSYAVNTRNTGVNPLTGISLSVSHRMGGEDTTWTESFSVAQTGDAAAGNPYADNVLAINEAGFMYPGHANDDYVGYHSFPDYFANYYRVSDEYLASQGFLRRGLPSQQPGMNQFLISASNAQGLNDTLAAYSYTVSESLDKDADFGRTVPGYRWGNDNGIVPAGSEFGYGFTSNTAGPGEPNNAGFVIDDCGHQHEAGYEVLTRYNTPSVIPTDDEGNPWVIRGIEFVTSTKVSEAQARGARFVAEMYRYELREGSDTGWYNYIYYAGLTGQEVYLVGEGNVAADEDDLLDYATAENGNYYAVNVFFPEQPAIEPNTSFLLGYTLQGGGDFAVASQAWRYKSQTGDFDESSNYTSYRNNSELAPYYNQFSPLNKPYDVYCYDPIEGSRGNNRHVVTGWNIDVYPLIRLIVGPKMAVDTHYVYANCTEDENERTNYWVHNFRTSICGVTDTVIEGAAYSYMVYPGDPNEEQLYEEGTDPTSGEDVIYYVADSANDYLQSKVIDQIFINGESLDLTDSNVVVVEDYTVYWAGHTPLASAQNRWDPALVRKAYMITLRDITDDVTISATVHDETLSIRDIEDNVNLLLAPNPATSQVRLNVSSFAGKANCSIIDMSGRVVYNADITSGETVINLNGVPAGAYFVRVTNDTFSKVEKLIVR